MQPGYRAAGVAWDLLVDFSAFLDSFFFSNRVAPASVDSSVHLRLWGKLFIGVTPPNREAECLVRKGVGL